MSSTGTARPLADALAAWDMAADGGTAADLAVAGAVRLGVALTGAERETSLVRGGNGVVAEFAGGHLRIEGRALPADRLRGDAMTFAMRLRDRTGRWDAPLFARDDPDDTLGAILYGTDGAAKLLSFARGKESGPATPWYHLFAEPGGPGRLAGSQALLEYRWRTLPTDAVIRFCEGGTAADSIVADARAGVLRVGVPVALVGPTAWHDVVFRFSGANLELFVDGVLVDEEGGYGPVHRFEPPFLVGAAWERGRLRTGFHGQVGPRGAVGPRLERRRDRRPQRRRGGRRATRGRDPGT